MSEFKNKLKNKMIRDCIILSKGYVSKFIVYNKMQSPKPKPKPKPKQPCRILKRYLCHDFLSPYPKTNVNEK